MKLIVASALLVFLVALSGCENKDYALVPVSGTVTQEGKPVAKMRVSFSPRPLGEDNVVGPYSSGKTDSDGKFTLKTRYGEDGAVPGKHSIGLEYSDIRDTAMDDLRNAMGEAKETGSKENFEKAKKRIEELKAKLKGRQR